MDERQTKITEGAGLEDSRVNKEFIDLLQKWSSPVLFLILIVAGSYAGLRFFEQQRITKLDAAFFAYTEAELERRPERLIQVASEQRGRGAIPELALLSAADLHMQAYHLRIMPGTLGVDAVDRLDDSQAAEMLTKAGELYADVFAIANGVEGHEIFAIGGRWGMAAVALTQKNFDEAEQALREVIQIAEPIGLTDIVSDANDLIASFPALRAQRDPVSVVEPVAVPEQESAPASDTPTTGDDDTPSDG